MGHLRLSRPGAGPYLLSLVLVGVASLWSAPQARAKTTVSATYGQVGARTLSAYTLVDGAPKKAYAVLETKRFSRSRVGRARTQTRRLPRSGHTTIKVGAPRGA